MLRTGTSMRRTSTIALLLLTSLWFLPYTHGALAWLDEATFKLLNHTLAWGRPWQIFWGMLNHRLENKIGLIFAIVTHFIFWIASPSERKAQLGWQLLFFWLCFEVVYLVNSKIFENLMGISRFSPSVIFPEDTLFLSELLQNTNVKDSSHKSFPSGHALFLITWGLLSWKLVPSPYRAWMLGLSLFMCIPRIISGAHWLSDIVFSGFLAMFYLGLVDLVWEKIKSRKLSKSS